MQNFQNSNYWKGGDRQSGRSLVKNSNNFVKNC